MRASRWIALGAMLSVAITGAALAKAGPKRSTETGSGTVPASNGVRAGATAHCAKGTGVAYGGAGMPANFDNLTLSGMRREGKRSWTIEAQQFGMGVQPVAIKSIAFCTPAATGKPHSTTETLAPSGPTEPETVTSTCPQGTRVAFGGFAESADPNSDLYLSSLTRDSQRSWTVGIYTFASGHEGTAIAYCSPKAPKTQPDSESTTLQPSGSAAVTATCPKGTRFRFGGFAGEVTGSNAFVLVRSMKRSGKRGWTVRADNPNSGSSGVLTAIAYCEV